MKLLLVEDELRTAGVLVKGLEEEGHEVFHCETAAAAREPGRSTGFDVILLDWALPDGEGIDLLREWRAASVRTPVLFLTARGSTGEKVTGLRAGADDYLVKPFAFDELLARVEALHRRGSTAEVPSRIGSLVLDARRRALVRDGQSVPLTAREFQLLVELAEHQGDVVARSHILQGVWGGDDANPNVVDVYVGYLRSKLDRLGPSGVTISAVRGVGYRLTTEDRP